MATGDQARWIRWRARRLQSAGFPAELARRLAGWDRIDLHELLELVDRGCPPVLAARILAPLEADFGRTAAPPGRLAAPPDQLAPRPDDEADRR
jgi:hypothetical protein